MSTYTRETKHPDTGEWEDAIWYDDLLGKHHYGVVFPSDFECVLDNIGTTVDVVKFSRIQQVLKEIL